MTNKAKQGMQEPSGASPFAGKQSNSDQATDAGAIFLAPQLAGLVIEGVTHDQVTLRWISRDSKTNPLRIVRSTRSDFLNEHEVHAPKKPDGVVDDDGLAANTLYHYKLIFSREGMEYDVTVDTYTMPAP